MDSSHCWPQCERVIRDMNPPTFEAKVIMHLEALRKSMNVLLSVETTPPTPLPSKPAGDGSEFNAATATAAHVSETNGYGDI
jgi:hypothetical protein